MPDGPAAFDFERAFAGLFRESYGRVVAALAKEFRDLELAEDALQEALATAASKWPAAGMPDNAAGWLYVVARHKAIDGLRREKRRNQTAITRAHAAPPAESGMSAMYGVNGPPDERLSLIFACCHPVINEPAQVALTLHALSALSTAEIAAGFLLKETAVAQRIVRAKRKIKAAGIPFAIPDIGNSPERLDAVLSVIYLIFNAGYTAYSGRSLVKTNLCDEALFLGRMLDRLVHGNPEVEGLLALLLFQDSRRGARVNAVGEPILLADQDRSLWNKSKIDEGLQLLGKARLRSEGGLYQTQAEIAAVHATSPGARETKWSEILRHYDRLARIHPTAVVLLNRAVAVNKAVGPAEALAALEQDAIAIELDEYRYYHSTRAEFLLDLHRPDAAKKAFERALELTANEQEQLHLRRRIEATQTNL